MSPRGHRTLAVLLAVLVLLPTGAATAQDRLPVNWQLDELGAEQVWSTTRGEGVVVGVVDELVEPDLPDLRGQVVATQSFGGGTGVSHGSAMASLVVGTGELGVRGLAPAARVVSAGVAFGAAGPPSPDDLAAAIDWVVAQGAGVVNLSLSTAGGETLVTEAIERAVAADVVVVAAAGNIDGELTDPTGVEFPARVPGVVAVGATGPGGRACPCSVTGPEVVLAAPGVDITVASSQFDSGVGIGSGTSSATALVSATAALVRAAHPDLDAANVVNRLVVTARDAGPAGRDPTFGFGVVDPIAAVTADVAPVPASPLAPSDTPTETGTDTATATPPGATGGPTDVATAGGPPPPTLDPGGSAGDQSALGAVLVLGGLVVVLGLGVVLWRRGRTGRTSHPA